jgi:hypothetical protein
VKFVAAPDLVEKYRRYGLNYSRSWTHLSYVVGKQELTNHLETISTKGSQSIQVLKTIFSKNNFQQKHFKNVWIEPSLTNVVVEEYDKGRHNKCVGEFDARVSGRDRRAGQQLIQQL